MTKAKAWGILAFMKYTANVHFDNFESISPKAHEKNEAEAKLFAKEVKELEEAIDEYFPDTY